MYPEPVDLLRSIKREPPYSSAVFGTYQFEGRFFEKQVLSTTQDLGIANVAVLTDEQQYEGATDLHQAGKQYYFDRVHCPGIHHPKFALFLDHDRGLAMIGSANLTEKGWRKNGEIITLIRYDGENSLQRGKFVFAQLSQF